MTDRTYTVFLPDRPLPICIEADDFAALGCEVVLRKGDEVVARTSDRGFVVRTDLARVSCANAEQLPWGPSVEHLVPGAVAEMTCHPAPVWPFLTGVSVACLCAVGGWLALA